MGVRYHKPPEGEPPDSHDFPDVGTPPNAVHSWAHDFDFPYTPVPQDVEKCPCTSEAVEAFFSQPRRSG
jgi:hypothetical protein